MPRVWNDRTHESVIVDEDHFALECGCWEENGRVVDYCDEHEPKEGE